MSDYLRRVASFDNSLTAPLLYNFNKFVENEATQALKEPPRCRETIKNKFKSTRNHYEAVEEQLIQEDEQQNERHSHLESKAFITKGAYVTPDHLQPWEPPLRKVHLIDMLQSRIREEILFDTQLRDRNQRMIQQSYKE